jgi:hypothetical protein
VSQYAALDEAIITRLSKERDPLKLTQLNTGHVRHEAERLAEATGREAFRVLDGRLQALRQAKRIRFSTFWVGNSGWVIVHQEQS